MSVRVHLPGYRWFHIFRNTAIRIGVYTAVCLAVVFTAWLFVANRVPSLGRLAVGRNAAAAALLVAWLLFSSYYRVLCLFFRNLSDWHSTFQVFMFGAVVYMIFATLMWIGGTIWRARAADASHPNHRAS
jgi:hypothetical protein